MTDVTKAVEPSSPQAATKDMDDENNNVSEQNAKNMETNDMAANKGNKTPAESTPAKSASTTTTTTTPKKTPSSPKISYISLVLEAVVNMKDRTGSSQPAIQKYIQNNHPEIPIEKVKQRLLHTLKTACANKRLLKVKASYKIHPDVKKKKKAAVAAAAAAARKKKAMKKVPERKALTKEELAAMREKEKKEAKEKERLDRIRKRKFPMDDLELIKEDKELKVSVKLPSRPALPLLLPSYPSFCKSDSMGMGMLDDAFHIYHFFRGDVGWGRLPQNKNVVAPFTLDQWLECIQQVIRGAAKKSRMIPPLMTHLFVVSLQYLVPKELQSALTPTSWSEVLMLYMDAMDRYYTTDASKASGTLRGVGIDTEFLFYATDHLKDVSQLPPPTPRDSNFYLQGSLLKIQTKLLVSDPWMLSAEELLALLKTLVDDMLATQPDCAEALDSRLQETYELLRNKRDADAHYRKLQNRRKKEEQEKKENEEKGEKPTRSNTKLPTVSDAQLESARRSQVKATDAYDKACRSQRIRTESIGEDRAFNALFHFWNDPERVFVAQRGKLVPSQSNAKVPGEKGVFKTTWHSIDKRSTLEKYIEALDIRGKRELGLKAGLEQIAKTVFDDIKIINEKKARLKEKQEVQRQLENARLKCEVGRKSGRLAAQSEQEFFDLQSEIDRLEKAISSDSDPLPEQDLMQSTGLKMLTEFDQRDEEIKGRRTTRRDSQKEDEKQSPYPRLKCSNLWSTGNFDGTGVVGSIVWDLIMLEERAQNLAPWANDRKKWISSLENAAEVWHSTSPPVLEEDASLIANPKTSPGDSETEAKKQRRVIGDVNPQSAHQVLTMMKKPLLELENRIFHMTGLAMAYKDTIDADDNMSTSDNDQNEEEQIKVAWKRLVHRLHRLPAKAHSKIRHLVVEAITAARKAHQGVVVGQLREALLQFHPEAAGACKADALEILENHGGYDDEDDDDDDDMDEDDETPEEAKEEQLGTGLSSVLSFESVILNSCLDGLEDATRSDWIEAVNKCKTISKFSALVAALCNKTSRRFDKMELEKQALHNALETWEKAGSLRKKTNSDSEFDSTEVWTDVNFTDDFCLVQVETFPWWPARKCIAKDKKIAESLNILGRSIVSLVGESGSLRVVKNKNVADYSETPENVSDLTSQPKDVRNQLEDCKAMARRIIRGKKNGTIKSS